MTSNELIQGIKELAQSQGFYGRLLRQIENTDSETIERIANGCTNMLDFIMQVEG